MGVYHFLLVFPGLWDDIGWRLGYVYVFNVAFQLVFMLLQSEFNSGYFSKAVTCLVAICHSLHQKHSQWWAKVAEPIQISCADGPKFRRLDHGLLVLLQSNLTWPWVTVGDCWWLGMMSSLFCPLAVPLSIQQKHLLVRPRLKHAPACPRNSSRKMKSTYRYNMINTINIGVSFISPHRIWKQYRDHVWIRLMVLVGRS